MPGRDFLSNDRFEEFVRNLNRKLMRLETGVSGYSGLVEAHATNHEDGGSDQVEHDKLYDYVANEHLPGIDEDDMVSDLDTAVPTQQSVKAYADLIKNITSYADSPMIITGGELSDGTNAGTLKVGALTALLRNAASDTAPLVPISLAEQDNETMLLADTRYHVVLTDAPAISIQAGGANGTTEIGIGVCLKEADDTVHFVEGGMRLQNGVAKLHQRAATLRPLELCSGCTLTETGGALTLGISAGKIFGGINKYTPFTPPASAAFDSNVADTFTRIYRDGGVGFTKQAGQTLIDSDNYDDNSGGVAGISVNHYSVHFIYLHPSDEHVYCVYGRDNFKLAEAVAEQPYGDLPTYISSMSTLLGKIITKKGTAIFDDVQMVTAYFFTGTAATSHANLGELPWVGCGHTGSVADRMIRFGAAGVAEERTYAQVLADLSAQAAAPFDWGGQNLINLGTGHDGFSDFVGNEHIDHAGVALTAGTGLTGGGDISANRTFNVDVGVADDKILQVDMVAGLTDGDILRATAAGIESRTDAEILAQLSASADATFDWNDQGLINVLNLEVKDISVDTTDDYKGLENHHVKKAGATDLNDDFYAHDNYVALDQVGGTIGYLSGLYTECWLMDGTVSKDIEAIYNKVVISGGVVTQDVIGSTDYIVMSGGSIDDLFGHKIDLDVAAALTITGNVYGHYIQADIDTDPTGDVYMVYLKEYDNIDYGFYQDGSALNVLGGALQLDTVADAGADVDKFLVLDAGNVVDYRTGTEVLSDIDAPTKTTAAWNKSIGATGDYATWAAMIADMPDLIAHAVTVTIEDGTTLAEQCLLYNKHGTTSSGAITIQAEKYFPTSGDVSTADSATATTLRDADLAAAALGNDYFNGCWIFIVDGTGTDNGFVLITDYVDATGDVVVAAWPGTQPDNTSRYIIVGALLDGGGTINWGFLVERNTVPITFKGIGFYDFDYDGIVASLNNYLGIRYCGFYASDLDGINAYVNSFIDVQYSGFVGNNTASAGANAGAHSDKNLYTSIYKCAFSDNNIQGVMISGGGFAAIGHCFGDGNGNWGVYARESGQVNVSGVECSGAAGNHSDPGTAGTANADQAAVY